MAKVIHRQPVSQWYLDATSAHRRHSVAMKPLELYYSQSHKLVLGVWNDACLWWWRQLCLLSRLRANCSIKVKRWSRSRCVVLALSVIRWAADRYRTFAVYSQMSEYTQLYWSHITVCERILSLHTCMQLCSIQCFYDWQRSRKGIQAA